MTIPQEYRKFADECLRWATEAETEEFRDAFIQMARDWTLAAMRLEGVLAPRKSEDEAHMPRHPETGFSAQSRTIAAGH